MAADFAFTLNGQATTVRAEPAQSLLEILRDTCGLKATRLGCGMGQCGACTVLVDGEPAHACDTSVEAAAGHAITTVEGLGSRAAPHPLQAAFIEEQALQCGFCTSGMLMRGAALLRRNACPSEDEIRQALDGNLCRCGVHNRIVRAVRKAAKP
jgi:nicotinate dehydrogenase subunit A